MKLSAGLSDTRHLDVGGCLGLCPIISARRGVDFSDTCSHYWMDPRYSCSPAPRVARIEGILRVIGADALEPERVRRAEASIGRLRAQLAELQAGESRLAQQARLAPFPAAAEPVV